jgi:hypothetical protein
MASVNYEITNRDSVGKRTGWGCGYATDGSETEKSDRDCESHLEQMNCLRVDDSDHPLSSFLWL